MLEARKGAKAGCGIASLIAQARAFERHFLSATGASTVLTIESPRSQPRKIMAIQVGCRLGHYDVTALIGEGGMGQVYQATDTKLNRQVALKILPEAFASDPDQGGRTSVRLIFLAALIALVGLVAAVGPGHAQGLESDHDWPQWRGPGRVGVWTETGILDTFPADGLKATWRTPIRSGYSGPAVASGRVFVTDAHFPDPKRTNAVERVLALDEETGEILWIHEWETNYAGLQLVYAIGPRATPTVDGDRVYVLGAMGNLFALDVRDGRVLWQKDYVRDFDTTVPSWGMSGAPLVDGGRLIALVGGEPGAKYMAFDKTTGEEIWRALSSDWEPGYSAPVIIEAARRPQLIAWHPRAISSLDPATGTVYWEVPHIVDMGLSVATAVRGGPHLFVTSQYGGAVTLSLDDDASPSAMLLWKGGGEADPEHGSDVNTFNSVISTPVIDGDYVYGLDGNGLLRCLDAKTGERVWESWDLIKEEARHATAFFVRHEDHYFINTDNGDLVIARLSPEGYREISRTRLIEPTHPYVRRRAHGSVVNWSHPAYANRHVVARNDEEIVRLSLAADQR